MRTLSLEYLLPEFVRTIIYTNAAKGKKHHLENTITEEIEKRLNLALDRQTYRVTQTRAAETFVGSIPNTKIVLSETGAFPYVILFGLLFEKAPVVINLSKEEKKQAHNIVFQTFLFLVGWKDEDNVLLAAKYQNLILDANTDLKNSKPNTEARKRAEIRFQYAAENYGRWLEKVMY